MSAETRSVESLVYIQSYSRRDDVQATASGFGPGNSSGTAFVFYYVYCEQNITNVFELDSYLSCVTDTRNWTQVCIITLNMI